MFSTPTAIAEVLHNAFSISVNQAPFDMNFYHTKAKHD